MKPNKRVALNLAGAAVAVIVTSVALPFPWSSIAGGLIGGIASFRHHRLRTMPLCGDMPYRARPCPRCGHFPDVGIVGNATSCTASIRCELCNIGLDIEVFHERQLARARHVAVYTVTDRWNDPGIRRGIVKRWHERTMEKPL